MVIEDSLQFPSVPKGRELQTLLTSIRYGR